ncbi:Uncharacterised protein [Serratia fonticola]|uniref:Uncharacterized protein n=1 Tax=Serratia fonticola TaxID=47917 RepID=A0A448SGQ8_SERFO|nr:Uncharacterised protein [Serratia fonticola]
MFKRLLLLALLFSSAALADRQVTDQLNRTVTLPDHITRAVVLQHQTLNLLVQLDAMPQVVGVLTSWQKQLGRTIYGWLPAWPRCPCRAILRRSILKACWLCTRR